MKMPMIVMMTTARTDFCRPTRPAGKCSHQLLSYCKYYGNSHPACEQIHKPHDVPLVEFMYLVFTRIPGGVYVPCIYSHTSGCGGVMYLVFTRIRLAVVELCTLYLPAYVWLWWSYVPCIYPHTSGCGGVMYLVFTRCQAVTAGDSGLCCCVCGTSFERYLTPLFVQSGIDLLFLLGYLSLRWIKNAL